jgi:elongation factor Ts
MSISAKQVKELRQQTNAGILDCKEALQENDGDMEAAAEWLEKKGITAAQKKSGRVAAEGLVQYWSSDDGTSASLVEVNCETDFVARNDDFQSFARRVTDAIGEAGVESAEEAGDVELDGEPISQVVTEQIATLGENINIRRVERVEAPEGVVGGYIHTGSQIGVLVSLKATDVDGEVEGFARDVAMHVAAMAPPYLDRDDIPEDAIESQKDVFRAQMEEQGKPDHIIPKIIEGKINKWIGEQTLVNQPFVKDSESTVGELQSEMDGVSIAEFVRFEVGEGIETEEEDFAGEVAEALDQE